jgi:hypothetical protein
MILLRQSKRWLSIQLTISGQNRNKTTDSNAITMAMTLASCRLASIIKPPAHGTLASRMSVVEFAKEPSW